MPKDTNPKDALGAVKWRQFLTVPRQVLLELGVAMLEGSLKYGRHNYRAAGVRASVYLDAAYGHLDQFTEGEDIDEDSGLSHVTKAIASLVVLRDAMMNDFWEDDRPPKVKDLGALRARLQDKVAENFARYAGEQPHHYTHKHDGAPYMGEPEQRPLFSPHEVKQRQAEMQSRDALKAKQASPPSSVTIGHNSAAQVSGYEGMLADPTWLPTTQIKDLSDDDPAEIIWIKPGEPAYSTEAVVEGLTQLQLDLLVQHESVQCGQRADLMNNSSAINQALVRRVLLRLKSRNKLWFTITTPHGETLRVYSRLREEWAIVARGGRIVPDQLGKAFA